MEDSAVIKLGDQETEGVGTYVYRGKGYGQWKLLYLKWEFKLNLLPVRFRGGD